MGGGAISTPATCPESEHEFKILFLGKQCVCWTNLQVTFEFQIVHHDILCCLALELGLLQTVLQPPQVL